MEAGRRQSGDGRSARRRHAAIFRSSRALIIWHALNAYSDGGEIIADFVGYDAPDHFAPHDALFYKIMQGEMGKAKTPGTLRRYRIDLAAAYAARGDPRYRLA